MKISHQNRKYSQLQPNSNQQNSSTNQCAHYQDLNQNKTTEYPLFK